MTETSDFVQLERHRKQGISSAMSRHPRPLPRALATREPCIIDILGLDIEPDVPWRWVADKRKATDYIDDDVAVRLLAWYDDIEQVVVELLDNKRVMNLHLSRVIAPEPAFIDADDCYVRKTTYFSVG